MGWESSVSGKEAFLGESRGPREAILRHLDPGFRRGTGLMEYFAGRRKRAAHGYGLWGFGVLRGFSLSSP
jgi:hypothetical protein